MFALGEPVATVVVDITSCGAAVASNALGSRYDETSTCGRAKDAFAVAPAAASKLPNASVPGHFSLPPSNHGMPSFLGFERADNMDSMDFADERSDVILCCAFNEVTNLVAVAVSDFRIVMYTLQGAAQAPGRRRELKGHEKRVNDIAFECRGNVLVSASDDGTVVGWNTTSCSPTFRISLGYEVRSVALTSEGCVVAGLSDGTIHFWKISSSSHGSPQKIGVYEESHAEAITQIKFHPAQPRCMITASEDGLLCVFNTSATSEDDALLTIANANSSVRRFGLFGPGLNCAWCLTATETLALWRIDDDCDEIANFEDVRDTIRKTSGIAVDYLVECFYDAAKDTLALLAGDHVGGVHVFRVTQKGFAHLYSFPRGRRSHSSTVRCVAAARNAVLTGGDDGILCVWPRVSGHQATITGASAAAPSSGSPSRGGLAGRRAARGRPRMQVKHKPY
eukprot:g2064.t1